MLYSLCLHLPPVELLIRLVFEQFMKPNKNVIISAERTRIIHIHLDDGTVDTQVLTTAG